MLGIVATTEKRIAEQRNRIETLESMVTTDPLTELENHRGFETFLDRILAAARRHDDIGVLVYIDMDNFKVTNDKYGHEAVDAVLVSVTEVLRKNTRTLDVVARIGGDEFAVLLTHTGSTEGLYQARRLNTFLSHADAHYRDLTIELRASFGTAPYGPEMDKKDLPFTQFTEIERGNKSIAPELENLPTTVLDRPGDTLQIGVEHGDQLVPGHPVRCSGKPRISQF